LLLTCVVLTLDRATCSSLFPYTTLFRPDPLLRDQHAGRGAADLLAGDLRGDPAVGQQDRGRRRLARQRGTGPRDQRRGRPAGPSDRKSTRLNSSHVKISYAVFCLKKKKR